MKTTPTKKYLSLLMAICMLMSCLMQVSAFATSIQESEMIPESGEEELMPMGASMCVKYVKSSLAPNCFTYRNATIYYTSNGKSSGTVYSIIYTNSFGGTIVRHDLASYNNMPLKHGKIEGQHTHTYEWTYRNGEYQCTELPVVSYTPET